MSRIETIGVTIFRRLAQQGSLDLVLPSGRRVTIGAGAPHAELTVTDGTAIRDIVRAGLLGFAEAYMDGRVDTPDLQHLLQWGVANHDAWFEHRIARLAAPIRKGWQRIRPERRHPKVRTMVDHYNLGNDFYRSWLDETVTYSSARFQHPDQDLASAQRHKYETIARHAGLKPGMRVLEIGCGWGGFAEYAATEIGCSVVGITIAEEQAHFARKRLAERGVTDLVEIRLEDFRATSGSFDAVVSIEMIESIDESQWPDLFSSIAARLSPGGRAVLQAITIGDELWEQYRDRGDFIQQYIFPGGQLPAPKVLRSLGADAGLVIEQIETFGLDYARTLDHWHQRFNDAWPDIREPNGLDERFKRMWDLYLVLCGAGFEAGRIDVEQWVYRAR